MREPFIYLCVIINVQPVWAQSSRTRILCACVQLTACTCRVSDSVRPAERDGYVTVRERAVGSIFTNGGAAIELLIRMKPAQGSLRTWVRRE